MDFENTKVVEFVKDDRGYAVVTANLARLSILEYTPQDIGINSGKNVLVAVTADELFSPKTIASFEGLPVTLDHPEDKAVKADTWKELAVGHVQNVRRNGEFLVGDIYLSDSSAIEAVELTGERDLSCGYDSKLLKVEGNDADYIKTNIIGNHVAIVGLGRAGKSCRLIDSDTKKGFVMNLKGIKAKVESVLSRINDAETVEATAEEAEKIVDETISIASDLAEKLSEVKDKTQEVQEAAPEKVDAEITDEDDTQDVEALKAENEALKAEIEELKAKLNEKEDESELSSVLNDCQTIFTNVRLNDAKTSSQAKKAVLEGVGVSTKTLNDSALAAAYEVIKAQSKNGKLFAALNDSAPAKKVLSATEKLRRK